MKVVDIFLITIRRFLIRRRRRQLDSPNLTQFLINLLPPPLPLLNLRKPLAKLKELLLHTLLLALGADAKEVVLRGVYTQAQREGEVVVAL